MKYVFISYVRENTDQVDQLAAALRKAGIEVWLDRERIRPGQRWRTAIRNAIEKGAFFIACFSRESTTRDRTYMNEELTVAIKELRLRPTDRTWFLPVLLAGGEISGKRDRWRRNSERSAVCESRRRLELRSITPYICNS